jgi:hypothetical protein
VLDGLSAVTKSQFDPVTIAEIAEKRLVSKRLRSAVMQEVREPSLDLCRVLLRSVGIENVHRSKIANIYSSMVRNAFEQAFVIPVLELLRSKPEPSAAGESETATSAPTTTTRQIVTTDRELAVFRYVCRRLAYLSEDERQFSAIEHVHYRDYLGKFVVYYRTLNKGRLFDFIEGGNGYDRFIFPAPFGEVTTNTMSDIDTPLKAIFAQRLREFGGALPVRGPTLHTLQA